MLNRCFGTVRRCGDCPYASCPLAPLRAPLPRRLLTAGSTAPGVVGSATARTANVAATLPPVTATDPARLCQLAVPAAFAEDSPGSGYFPARDKTGYVAVDAPDRAGGANTFDQALATVLANLKILLPGYVETNVVRGQGSLRVEFTATPSGAAGRGVAHFKNLGPFVCGATLFLSEGSPIPFDTTLQGLVGSLQVVKGAKPLPTATAVPPTPTPRLTALTAYKGAPIPPGSVLLEEEDNAVTFLSPFDTEAETSDWLDREWTAAGMVYVADVTEQGYTFHAYRDGERLVLFTTEKVGNLIGFTIGVAK